MSAGSLARSRPEDRMWAGGSNLQRYCDREHRTQHKPRDIVHMWRGSEIMTVRFGFTPVKIFKS